MARHRPGASFVASMVAGALVALGCTTLKSARPEEDAGSSDVPDAAETESDGGPSATTDAGGLDAQTDARAPCRTLPLECLDPTPPSVHEVPTESTLAAALAAAKPDDVVQVRATTIDVDASVPDRVTLRGCEGAQIASVVSFAGGDGTVEGFTVSGSIVAQATGSFVVRRNRFVAPASGPLSTDAILADSSTASSADVTMLVDANRFDGRARCVTARTSNSTGPRKVTVTVRNNVFVGIQRAFSGSNATGTIVPVFEHNSLFGFDTAVYLQNVASTTTHGNVFASGNVGIDSLGSDFTAEDSIAWQVTNPYYTPPVSGTVTNVDPMFTSSATGDLRLTAGSPAIDAVAAGTTVPPEDYAGCPRPAGTTSPARADVGAYERQP